MKANFWIKTLNFKNGNHLELNSNSIVVFVGPNNAGKSLTLNEIYRATTSNNRIDGNIVSKIVFKTQGDDVALLDRLKTREINGQYYVLDNQSQSRSFNEKQVKDSWKRYDNSAEGASNYADSSVISMLFVKQLNTANRLHLIQPANVINFLLETPSHPIHELKVDEEKELIFSNYFKQAFGTDIIVNHSAGTTIPLHVGQRPIATVKDDRVSRKYAQELSKLDLLHNQGDGMKSFAGVFLSLFATDYSINLIDEPEAFLHPPQASLLGQMISKSIGVDKQIFIATHSEHFLKGLLDQASDRLIIVRIQRDGQTNRINTLNSNDIKAVWSDSLLKHSNVLDGLFHKKVVLCESDSDNRFFSAMSTTLTAQQGLSSKDVLFVQSGGKHRFPVVIKALKKLDVPLTVIGDFDLYNNEQPIRTMFEDLSGNWEEIKTDFKIVKQSIDQKKPELETAQLKKAIDDLFSTISGNVMPEEKIKQIEKELKRSSPWTQAKSSGKAYLPPGDATNAFNRVQIKLQEKGIYILEVGEIEAFDKTVGGHGPKWVNEVLVKDITTVPELTGAREFVSKVILS